jgi:small subunit ribosomal protein S1
MREKNYDDFFDEDTTAVATEQKLMQMVDDRGTGGRSGVSKGSRVSGKIVRLSTAYAFIDLGGKNEAVFKIGEFKDKDGTLKVKEGDLVEGYVMSITDSEIMLSRALGAGGAETADLIDAMRARVPVSGKVTGINKGGINVTIMGKKAFCPISQIELHRIEDANPYFGKTMEFVITQVTEGGRNVVISRIPILERGREKRIDALVEEARKRALLSGPITRIAPFGLFVELGGVEGLVHISEASWDRTEKLEENFQVGQTVNCVVLSVEKKEPLRESRISLSIRQVEQDPWTGAAERFAVGASIAGRVTRLAEFGAFVRVAPGLEGLVHISEMTWNRRVRRPHDLVTVGQEVRVTVLRVDEAKKEMSLTIKDMDADPWRDAAQKYAPGTVMNGTVAERAKFGYFVDLVDGVTGLLTPGRIAADKKDQVRVGAQIAVKIESLDVEKHRVGLSFGMSDAPPENEGVDEYFEKQEAATAAEAPKGSDFAEALKAAMTKKK